ncbi:MAG: InlB B-repeat-containing protein [Oscillospiraceae bacterium]|nr:InlB B-repeat-containing protein [Oscillospiraceae bacterium]
MKKITSLLLVLVLVAGVFAAVPVGVLAGADVLYHWSQESWANEVTKYSDYQYRIANGKATIVEYLGTAISLKIPATLGGAPVTQIGQRAFASSKTLTSVLIPESVTTIGEEAFDYCYNLETINIPNAVKTIGKGAFTFCRRLSSITIPDGVTAIDDFTFRGCSELRSISLPNSVTSIGIYAFDGCGLRAIELSENLKTIGRRAFSFCTELSSIVIPASVTKIDQSAFMDGHMLSLVYIYNSAITIGPTVFDACYSVRIVCAENSNAHKYAKSNDIPFEFLKSVTVQFNSNGGSKVASKAVYSNAAIGTLPSPTRTGYTFKGWYTAKTGGTKIEKTTKITKAQTLYAQWTAKKFTVTYSANGGKIGTATSAKKSVTYASKYVLPTAPKRTGYKFAGWYTAKTGGTKVTASTVVKLTKNQTLYAHWTANKYTVTFNANGGTAVKAKAVTYNTAVGALPTPTRKGYKLVGWYTAKSGGTKIAKTTKVTKATTYYAHWAKK